MQIRLIAAALVLAVVAIALASWPRQKAGPIPEATPPAAGSAGQGSPEPASDAAPADPGIEWTTPSRWAAQPERPMRLATYVIPAAPGDREGAECAVFYFGPNQGGGVEPNIERWVGQFEHATAPSRSSLKAGGLEIARVRVAGTYLTPGGPAMKSQGKKSGYLLLGAIVTGPGGQVFFKVTGPQKTVEAAAQELDRLLASLRKK